MSDDEGMLLKEESVLFLAIILQSMVLATRKSRLLTRSNSNHNQLKHWENYEQSRHNNDTEPRPENNPFTLALNTDKPGQNYNPEQNISISQTKNYFPAKLPVTGTSGRYAEQYQVDSGHRRQRRESLRQRLRTSRIFSIFSLVRFKNEACTPSGTRSTYIGTCYLATECSERVSNDEAEWFDDANYNIWMKCSLNN